MNGELLSKLALEIPDHRSNFPCWELLGQFDTSGEFHFQRPSIQFIGHFKKSLLPGA